MRSVARAFLPAPHDRKMLLHEWLMGKGTDSAVPLDAISRTGFSLDGGC